MSGLWHVLGWLLVIVVLIAVGVLIFILMRKRAERKAAQQNAVHWRNEAAGKVNRVKDGIEAEEFARLGNSETYNPDNDNLTTEEYVEIAERYKDIYNHILNKQVADSAKWGAGSTTKGQKHHKAATSGYTAASEGTRNPPPAQEPVPASTYQPQTVAQTTIINEAPYMPIPVYVDEPVIVEHHHHHYDDDDSGSSSGSSSSSSSFDSDSSSSWSDSSSSSSFDSGGSSDFGGGSSDF